MRSISLPSGFSVVVPVYNAQETLRPLAQRLRTVLKEQNQPFEIIWVNDGSKDESWDIISDFCATGVWNRGINLARNYGQHNALLCGIRCASYDRLITLDDDLQNPPEEIPKLISRFSGGCDLVYGIPAKNSHPFWRQWTASTIKLALSLTLSFKTANIVSPFRLFKTQLRSEFSKHRNPFINIDILLSWGAIKIDAVTVDHSERSSGVSGYDFKKLLQHTLNMIIGYSTMPLKIASMLGFVFMLVGLLLILYIVWVYFTRGVAVPGFTFLASIISIFAGVQLFTLGVMGEYLSRIYFSVIDKPVYTIDAMLNEPQTGGAV